MVMKLFPIKSAQTTVVGAGSEPLGLKRRHPGFLNTEGKIKASRAVKAPSLPL